MPFAVPIPLTFSIANPLRKLSISMGCSITLPPRGKHFDTAAVLRKVFIQILSGLGSISPFCSYTQVSFQSPWQSR